MNVDELILEEAQKIQPEMISTRRELHKNPETGFDLDHTVLLVLKKLKEMGYQPERCGKAGVVATIGNGQGKTFLLRGDMDALPIEEDTDLAFKSTNGKMHACGHDTHTTMLLGAAKLLKAHEAEIKGTVKLMFQPAEEIMLGASDMIKAGVLENPHVDAGMMIHVMPGLPMDNGTLLVANKGKALSSCDWFEIEIFGKNGHGSMPHNAIDPIVPAANIHMALMEIQTRELPADALVALTVGEFHAGNTSNVIPETAILKGTLRTYDDEMRVTIKRRMVEIAESIAKAYRCKAEVRFLAGAPTLVNDEAVVKHAERILPGVVGSEKVIAFSSLPNMGAQMGSEDFAYVSHEIPSVLLGLAAADSRLSEPYPVHHPKLVLSEDILPYGAAAHVSMALSWLNEHQ
ncbi:amidohydrolase [Vagococcus sp. BWB3-3]|uniref:Amidohydrolase n=1 Tax=Vagococcus allomyrinae TaxID=2794353 RepID=A0A940SYZ9_9ENTE|nr:M20 family metallopeptidase [Vagococcus allomyrinae]MBP1043918.1 amidohydrolase [Vagococcus allomyrinae]